MLFVKKLSINLLESSLILIHSYATIYDQEQTNSQKKYELKHTGGKPQWPTTIPNPAIPSASIC